MNSFKPNLSSSGPDQGLQKISIQPQIKSHIKAEIFLPLFALMQTRDPRTASWTYSSSVAPCVEHEFHKEHHPMEVIDSQLLSSKRSDSGIQAPSGRRTVGAKFVWLQWSLCGAVQH